MKTLSFLTSIIIISVFSRMISAFVLVNRRIPTCSKFSSSKISRRSWKTSSLQLNQINGMRCFQRNTIYRSTSCLYSSGGEESTITTIQDDQTYEAEQTIKKSRFIGLAKHCTNWEDAQNFIASVNVEHPKARHVCFAFVAGSNPVQERCSDDGEPTGTAGLPILGGIKGEELSDTVCCVVRYSGGIKLGAGGLIRAYGGTARLVLREADTVIMVPTASIRLSTSSSNAGSIYSCTAKYNGSVGEEIYNEKGDLEVTITCEANSIKSLEQEIQDATRGATTIIVE